MPNHSSQKAPSAPVARYLACIAIPAAGQLFLVFLLIAANNGNGSWVGLGALLFGMFAIPLTALANGVLVYRRQHRPLAALVLESIAVAVAAQILLVPVLMLG